MSNDDRVKELEDEVHYLRFYKSRVFNCLGPADSEIEDSIREEYKKKFSRPLPPGYAREE